MFPLTPSSPNRFLTISVKSTPVRGHAGPEGSRSVKAPRFLEIGTIMVVGCQPHAPAAFAPGVFLMTGNTWYSFLVEAESTPGPYCDRKDYVTEKIL